MLHHTPCCSIALSSSSLSTASFFFNDPATTEIYPLSLRDALPICRLAIPHPMRYDSRRPATLVPRGLIREAAGRIERKSTRLNSSHQIIPYAVFCLKKKTSQLRHQRRHIAKNSDHDWILQRLARDA